MLTSVLDWPRYLIRLIYLTAVTVLFSALLIASRIKFLPWIGGRGGWVLREYFQACGGGFVKLGQILAMRYDILPESYCLTLQSLLDKIPPEPAERIFAVIAQELGQPIDKCFASIDSVPLGTASIAQVHRAVLHDGSEVAVKVLRPGIARRLKHDLRTLRWIATLFDFSGLFLPTRLRPTILENEQLALEELDLSHEARNMDLLHRVMANDAIDHASPRVWFKYSSKSVITMELFRGVWCHELLAAVAANDHPKLEQWRLQGITPRRAARLIFRSIMEQCYHHRVFHADPHAGNLVFLPGGTLGYIDFGMVGWLDEKQWSQQYRLFEEISAERLHGAYEAMLDCLEPLTTNDLAGFEHAFKGHLRDWMMAVHNREASITDKSTGRFLWKGALAMRQVGLRMPWSVMRLHRTTITSDVIELKLDPELDLMCEMRTFFLEDACRAAFEPPNLELAGTSLLLQASRLRDLPSIIGQGSDFFVNRLPAWVRRNSEVMTRTERSVGMAFRYLRASAVLAALLLFVSLWWIPSWLGFEVGSNRPERILAIILCLAAAYVLNKMITFYSES